MRCQPAIIRHGKHKVIVLGRQPEEQKQSILLLSETKMLMTAAFFREYDAVVTGGELGEPRITPEIFTL